MINHGSVDGANLMSSYNHLSRFAVSSGQSVSKGALVGYSGTTGTSQVCHLHFEVYVNGSTVDPMSRSEGNHLQVRRRFRVAWDVAPHGASGSVVDPPRT
ncbi:M23 family metallopeptidase [Oerskovia sp. M15]